MKDADARALLRDLFEAALAAARPATCLAPYIDRLQAPKGRTVVIGAGKASAAMARAVEDRWPHPLEGLVVTRYGYGETCKQIEIVEAAHPVPDEKGRAAAGCILDKVKGLSADDLVLCLISGGASALLALPAPGLTLADKQQVNRALLRSGANIVEMNTVRKHLSAIKGGRLAVAAQPARVLSWLISDVPNDDPGVIGSGPTVADRTTFADALAVLAKYEIVPPDPIRAHLEAGAAGRIEETPKPGDPRLANVETILVATPRRSLEAAAEVARRRGCDVVMLGDNLEGEARALGAAHGREALDLIKSRSRPTVILSGGETTVTVRGKGRGGRNVEYLLSEAIAAGGAPEIWGLAADTDGVDGAEDIAGALFAPDTLDRARAKGRDPVAMLDDNDGHGFFEMLGDSLVTGPTRTNVNDFRATLVVP
ncbi:glycerate kinase [Enhydrobacter sp.]|jgi:hydroxypyruvate reductase|uniref:glycerate kinase type-2 family protein n=1 Tax=Enhydrobacter sp. TaxID=1894999 RepID=UPI00260FA09D|nr:glycerate kinase [Enhydrobacter sp.]WIM13218.1 MAG: D-glycerate 2-kinase [Enhydrobacter sp.]